ncbi:MAG: hypothetical protein IPG58_10115 [Acidobacteria bacterium]|nr:hypothetical protein [Acidobacteriota bacterium]
MVANGTWQHVAATRNRTTGAIELFINGVSVATGVGGTQSLTAPARLTLGRLQTNISPFNGLMDEVEIFDRQLTQPEIQSIVNAGNGLCSTPTPTPTPSCGTERAYGISNGFNAPADNTVYSINLANGGISGVQTVTLPGFTVYSSQAMTARPSDGVLFAIVQTAASTSTARRLVTIDPATGVATDIGSLGINMATLAFRANGVLYGVTGNGGTNPETLYTINTTNAAITLVTPLGNGADGETIAFHPNGLLYHSSGNGTALFESVNVDTFVVTPIGSASSEMFAMGYSPANSQLYGSDIGNLLFTINIATGARTTVGTIPAVSDNRGLAIYTPPCSTPTPTPLADLAIVKTDNVSVVTTPGTTTYTLTVTNAGPAPAVNAIVTDNFPAGVIVDNWTCLPQNEALCTLDGAGNINEAVYIPVGGILTYTANVSIAAGQTGTLVNTATVTAPPTVVDPNLANNTSTDTDTYGMSISGNVQQFVQGGPNTNLAGVLITAQPGGATATTNASGNFTIAGVPGTTYTLTPTMAGKVFDPVSRVVTSTANVTGVNFIAYNSPGGIPRNIFVVNTHATPGNPVTVPIRMTSQGTEKVMTFSIDYPLEKLFSPVVTCGASTPGCAVASVNVTPGKLGITITAAGAGVAAGLREIANVTFQTNIGFAPPNAALTFSTTPTAQSVRDAANNELQKTFTNGFVVFVDGVESDVAGRNTGNGTVASTDVVQVRRFVANLDQVDPAFNEFQRADAAPLGTRGDGALLPGDVVQARRYAASLDGIQAAAGRPAHRFLHSARVLSRSRSVRMW